MTGRCGSDWKPREVEVGVERVARKDDLVVTNPVLRLRQTQSACEPASLAKRLAGDLRQGSVSDLNIHHQKIGDIA